jgi:SAM-dependent methyltransferase
VYGLLIHLPSEDGCVNQAPKRSDRRLEDIIGTTRATYDDVGQLYADANREVPQSVRDSLDLFVAALPPTAVVADIGCGPGRDLAELRARGVTVFGFDLSWGMLRAGPMPAVVQADMTRLPVRSAALDGIWCAASFLHVPRELGAATLAGFARVVRTGGVLHLSVAEGSAEGVEPARYGSNGDLWVVQRDEAELRRDLASAGFSVTTLSRSESHRRWLTLAAVRDGSRD